MRTAHLKTAACVTLLFVFISKRNYSQQASNDSSVKRILASMDSLYTKINKDYVTSVDLKKMLRTGIDAMLGSLDPFTKFRSKEEAEEFHLSLKGKFGGTGMAIREIDHQIVVFQIFQGFPADRAGLKTGDVITEVNATSTTGKNLFEVLGSLRGAPGTKLSVLVQKPGQKNPTTVNITREEIKLSSVPYYGIVSDDIGYIMLTGMTENSADELLKAFMELRGNSKLKGLVLDLRDNTGGYVNQAVKIANFFIDQGHTIVTVKGRNEDSVYYATQRALDPSIPLIILTSNITASAAEVLSGAIQDNDRGVIIGQRTYGKGLVGNIYDMGFGAEAVITIAHYYTPSGRCIQIRNYAAGIGGVETADSLKKYFKTKNGRLERESDGIVPDFVMEPKRLSPISLCVVDSFILFKYATQYKLTHSSIPPARQFALNQEEYDKFIDVLTKRGCAYTTSTEEKINELKKIATSEGYLKSIELAIKNLEADYKRRKQQDISLAKKEIKELLEAEIVSRYYYERGRIESGFQSDPILKKALEALNDKVLYKKTLGIVAE